MPANPERMKANELMYSPIVIWVNRVVENEAKIILGEKDELMRRKASKFLVNGIKLAERPRA